MRTRLATSVTARRLTQVLIDSSLIGGAWCVAFLLRFDDTMPERYQELMWHSVAFVIAGKLLFFSASGFYSKLWRFVDARDFEAIVRAVVLSSFALIGAFFVIPQGVAVDPPRGVIAADFLLTLTFVGGTRFLVRTIKERPLRGALARRDSREVLIVGAGNGGQLVAAELRRNPDLRQAPVGFVDDDPRKQGMRVAGLKVLGTTDQLPRVLDDVEPDEVIIAIPSAPGVVRQKVVTACRARSIPVRTLPTVFELLQGGGNVLRQVRDVQVEDVLGREPVRIEVDRVGVYMRDEVVLVTGAGGSIGAELSRQIARVGPKLLILLDHAENALFEIRRELEHDRHFSRSVAVLADCKDAVRMREIFADHRPTIVFHAAAYKHVPLMEENPVEAVRNNAVATRIVAAAAGELGTRRFVLVSTDKAVSPATVMGASKTLAEWSVEASQHRYPTCQYATVRFGNVLGSSGSVVPIFRRQIAAGGPVTVTDAAMTRYFMTIPEAVQLIIRAGALEGSGQVYVLEMGEPVKIIDLARNMIRLSGHEPDEDIAIEIVGRRPGEKIHEELFNPGERPQPTPAEKILVAERPPLDPRWVDEMFSQVEDLTYSGDAAGLASMIARFARQRHTSATGATTSPAERPF
jgi:FlaA1/EpsC-like NDP-sugar epimerase